MTEYDPKDGEAAGIAAFNMMIGLIRILADKGDLTKGEALGLLSGVTQRPPMPGTSPPYQVTKNIQEWLQGEIDLRNQRP